MKKLKKSKIWQELMRYNNIKYCMNSNQTLNFHQYGNKVQYDI